MILNGSKITFTASDAKFIKKFGVLEAADMVMNYRALNNLPFIYDTYQLAEFLCVDRKYLFRILKKGCKNEYELKTIKKKNGSDRTIQAPVGILKYWQKTILNNIVSKLSVSKYATAYKKGARLQDNANPHTGKKYLLKMDITDFFGSIRFEQVYSAAFNSAYFPKQIGVMLTTLCCYNDVLPQGAPTSPALSNLVMKNFDNSIGSWCEKRGISYTRYCDDLTFSSDKPLYNVFVKVKKMLENMGFTINDKKTHFVTNSDRQTVTGLTVNEKVGISKDYKRNLRQEIYYIFRFGPADSLLHTGRGEYLKNGRLNVLKYLDVIQGKINFVLSVEPDNEYFVTALEKIKDLRPKYLYEEEYDPYYE